MGCMESLPDYALTVNYKAINGEEISPIGLISLSNREIHNFYVCFLCSNIWITRKFIVLLRAELQIIGMNDCKLQEYKVANQRNYVL